MCEFLSDLAIADPQTDPLIYLRLLSALPRIARESLNLQKYRDTAAAAAIDRAKAPPAENPTNPIIDEARSEAIRTALLDKLDDIMGFKSYRNLPRTPFDPANLLRKPTDTNTGQSLPRRAAVPSVSKLRTR